jgi:hypothetical protein
MTRTASPSAPGSSTRAPRSRCGSWPTGRSPIGEDYFDGAIRRAVALRRDLFKLDGETDAYRLINSDGDGLSGLTIDRYGDVLLCEVYSLGIAQRLPKWLPLLHELAGTKFARVHVDHDLGSLEGIKPSTFNETNAAAPQTVKIRENGVRYEVDFAEGHKTGFFCDQRENRKGSRVHQGRAGARPVLLHGRLLAQREGPRGRRRGDERRPRRGRDRPGAAQRQPEPGAPQLRPRRRLRLRPADVPEQGNLGRGRPRPAEVHLHPRRPRQLGGPPEI